MPYNVICLACTAVALAFGPLHNISTKRLVLKNAQDGLLSRLTSAIKKKVSSIASSAKLKLKGKKEEKVD